MNLPIIIPLLNPNEPDALVAALHVKEGQYVSKGEALVTLETTKSVSDLTAEVDGYVVGLRIAPGQFVHAGDLLGFLSDTPDWHPSEQPIDSRESPTTNNGIRRGPRITQPAQVLVDRYGLDLTSFPEHQLVTESMVRKMITERPIEHQEKPAIKEFDPSAIVVFGGGGHGKTVIDLLRTIGSYQIVGIIDDNLSPGETIMDVPVLGNTQVLAKFNAQGVHLAANAVGGIGNIAIRIKVFDNLRSANYRCPFLVHPRAVIEPSAEIEDGVQIFAGAYIGSEARVGYGCIVNTSAIISHDCQIEKYANISPGAILAGGVSVGEGALIGMGATVNLQVRVGDGARVGNGATVKEDVPNRGIVRAGTIWP